MELVREQGGYHVIYTTHAPLSFPKHETRMFHPKISTSCK